MGFAGVGVAFGGTGAGGFGEEGEAGGVAGLGEDAGVAAGVAGFGGKGVIAGFTRIGAGVAAPGVPGAGVVGGGSARARPVINVRLAAMGIARKRNMRGR